MSQFTPIPSEGDIKALVKSAFDAELNIDGSWGYSKEEATILKHPKEPLPLQQLQHTLASMRTYLEMHMTRPEESRYGSINLNEISRKDLDEKDFDEHSKHYEEVQYEVTAMLESDYAAFIDEYKEGYGEASFDINDHFKRRKEKTLTREITYWFETSQYK